MEYAIAYIASIFVLQVLACIRTPREDCQVVILVTVFWPFILVLVAASYALDYIGWGFDAVRSPKMFNARKPTNPDLKGFALTLFFIEFQMWKKVR